MSGIFGGLLGSLSGLSVQYLVVAGGGGGGQVNSDNGGGGGAGGGVISGISPLTVSNSINVTVGAGGTTLNSASLASATGGSSTFGSFVAAGGGYGGGYENNGTVRFAGGTGGSSGGSSVSQNAVSPSPSGQGFTGGFGINGYGGGGGGGGGAQGGSAVATSNGLAGAGGIGFLSSITGTETRYAGGGGGGGATGRQSNTDLAGSGGAGGGGRGASASINSVAGTANRGGGGGGGGGGAPGGTERNGAQGGSGVIILRYPSNFSINFGAGLSASTATTGSNKVTTITAGTGNISFVEGSANLQSALNISTSTGLIGQFFTGVNYTIATGNVGTLPLSNPTTYSSISYINQGDLYGFIAIGYFKPPTTGTYTFFTSSDDGSGVWVGSLASAASGRTTGNAVLNNNLDGGQGDTKRSGTISLTAGEWYAIRIVHEEGGGGDNLTFSWSGPGIAETTSLATHFKRPVNLEGSLINTFYELT